MDLKSAYLENLGTPPNKVYKFFTLNENFYKTISGHYFWLSKPADFNDPFDCNPHLITFKPTKQAIKLLFKSQPLEGTRRQRRNTLKGYFAQPEKIKKIHDELKFEMNNVWGICCFTKTYKNILMWSHYANKHTGVCLGFEPALSPDTFLISNVKYTNHFQPMDYGSQRQVALFNMFITKSEDWKYEEEMRLVGHQTGKWPFPKKVLREVIFGCKTSKEDKKKVLEFLKANGYDNVIYKQATMREDSFLLDFKELNDIDQIN
ncbi:DUF2971 domain-containing protein [Adhaeribacter rhizoryzae]|uniref:DUF2971 domain-containing protein n=1 Tax=Adhaeribacter rhizoryzae TaxID=2607907 RepID=A0A5M6DSU4_9BACT|nr:DUF2971 domain-containing protein [Adhaeribacter rhizoryzae]KAA5549319.1 DUF2971 domain-containing protein [Adhaeribacter rhizoryzae]